MEEEITYLGVQRCWGIWRGYNGDGGFLRDTNGRFIYYPNPGVAAAHARALNRDIPDPSERTHIAKEFTTG